MIPASFMLGPFTLHFYGLIIAVGSLLSLTIAKKRASIYKVSPKIFDELIILIPLILALVFARIYHIIDKWAFYSQNPQQIIAINNGGLGIWGGLFGIVLGALIIAKIKKISPLILLDLISPSIILGQAIGRFGNFVNQEGFGPPSELPWSVYIKPENRPEQYLLFDRFHPTFFYESFLDLVIFLVLLQLTSRFRNRGQIFGLYLILYSLARFITEFLRLDTATLGTIHVSHIISISVFALGLYLFKRHRNKGLDNT